MHPAAGLSLEARMGQHQEPDQKLHTDPSPGVTDGYRGVGGSRRFAVPESQPVSKEFCCLPLQVQMTLLFTWTPFLLTVPGTIFFRWGVMVPLKDL